MKARFSSPVAVGLALSILPFVGACTEDEAASSLISSANAEPAVATTVATPPATPTNAVEPVAVAAPAGAEPIVAAPEPAPAPERKLPSGIRTNSPALDVIKMAQAGVDETVMLTFITNTTSMFVLTADEIVYLNDIGVPGTVVTAMMHRDQEIKQFWSNANQPVAPPQAVVPADTQAAAPTYVNPPQPEPQPAPAEAAPAQPTVVNNNYFYDTLSPYGTWVEIDGYGRCWQPTVVVVNRNWRPYSDGGRWVYTDAGWYWLSDYSWGATTFHYGRWFNHARWGWCWWPDTVWAPSWVTFRYGGDYCGWAPLPPHSYYRTGLGFSYYGRSVGFSFDFGLSAGYYTFVSWNRFCDPRPWHHRVRPHEVTRIYNNTTIVNNYVTGDNNTVINRGIGRDRVRELARTEIKTVSLRDAGPARSPGVRQERLERDGRTLVVNRPQFAPQRERSTIGAAEPERPVSAASARSETLVPVARESQSPSRPVRQERPETVRAAASPVVSEIKATPAPAAPVTVTPRAESRPTREVPGNRIARPNASTTAPTVNFSQPTATSPATVNRPAPVTPGQSKVESPSPGNRPTRPQPNPVVVIGKPQGEAPTATRTYPVYNSPQSPSRPVQPQATAPSPVSRPSSPGLNPTPRVTPPASSRQEIPRVSRSISPPSVSRSERPVYSAPAPGAPSVSRPAPSYSPRVATPAPSYTPPAVSPPRPAPSVSAPTFTPRPAPAAPPPAVSAPRSAPVQSTPVRPSAPSGSRSESGGQRPGR